MLWVARRISSNTYTRIVSRSNEIMFGTSRKAAGKGSTSDEVSVQRNHAFDLEAACGLHGCSLVSTPIGFD